MTFCDIRVVHQSKFQFALKHFPEEHARFRRVAKRHQNCHRQKNCTVGGSWRLGGRSLPRLRFVSIYRYLFLRRYLLGSWGTYCQFLLLQPLQCFLLLERCSLLHVCGFCGSVPAHSQDLLAVRSGWVMNILKNEDAF